MKKLILFSLVLVLSGCGLFKQVHKEKTTLKTEASQEVKRDSSSLMINHSIITVKEKVDTVLLVPEKTVRQETILNMDSLISGMTAVKNDLVNVSLVLNPVTHVLSAVATLKSQLIPLKIDKQTITQNNIVQTGNQSTNFKVKTKSAATRSIVDKKPVNLAMWLMIAFICVLAIGLVYWLVKEKLKLF
ncbi:hypothetical protein [Pedobacter sp. L105]|uniref:hypothetical protein n=1 Tax=Pedobacter sp. L105 TaxID=1641871 RepID=UPI00131B399D|nr:hypothetical protein [Pedobacter sp. L105]